MKQKFIFLLLIFAFFSCEKEVVKKPEKLIDENTMVDIFYDLTLLDAMKSNNPIALEQNNIDPYNYIYKKYKIDSLQFVQNNIFYASDLNKYKEMYEKVELRIDENKIVVDSLAKIHVDKITTEQRKVKDSLKRTKNLQEKLNELKN